MSNESNIECPICFEEIDLELGNFIELECCKNIGHIKCLENWIQYNKSPGICYYCQQNNNYFKPPSPLAPPEIVTLSQTNSISNTNLIKRICIFLFIVTIFIVTFGAILILLL